MIIQYIALGLISLLLLIAALGSLKLTLDDTKEVNELVNSYKTKNV